MLNYVQLSLILFRAVLLQKVCQCTKLWYGNVFRPCTRLDIELFEYVLHVRMYTPDGSVLSGCGPFLKIDYLRLL
jgi:hypothetical protein